MPGRLRRRRIVYILPVQPIKKEPVGLFLLAGRMRAKVRPMPGRLRRRRIVYILPVQPIKKEPAGLFLLAIKKAPVLAPWGDVTLWRQVTWYSNVSLELCVKPGIMLVASVSARRNRHRLIGLIFHAVELLHQSVDVDCVFVCYSGVQDFGGGVIGCGFFHCLVPFRLFGGPFYKCSA